MKKTKEKTPEFVVDLTWCKNPNQIYCAFGIAKQEVGLPMTNQEFRAIIAETVNAKKWAEEIVKDIFGICDCVLYKEKKPNVFRRFWNWITRKNKKTAGDQLK